jgi:hypothetical protein
MALLTHPATAQWGEDFVRAKANAELQWHVLTSLLQRRRPVDDHGNR